MFDAHRLLGVLLETTSPGSGADRLERLATVCAPPQPGLAEAPARFAPQEVAVGTVIDNERASIKLRAMIQAVKADGRSEAEHRQ